MFLTKIAFASVFTREANVLRILQVRADERLTKGLIEVKTRKERGDI